MAFFEGFSASRNPFITGAYLFILYVAAIYFSASLLATHQTQQELQALGTKEAPVYFWLLEKIVQDTEKLEAQAERADISTYQHDLKKLMDERIEEDPKFETAMEKYVGFMDQTLGNEGLKAVREANDTAYVWPSLKYDFLLENTKEYTTDVLTAEQIEEKVKQLRAVYSPLYDERETRNEMINNLQKVIEVSQKGGAQSILDAVQDKLKSVMNDEPSREQVTMAYAMAMKLHSLNSGLFPDFSTKQPVLVTLFLVLIMGGLGGLISLTQSFLSDSEPDPHPSYYIFRPILGILAAFAVFILVKAGVLVAAGATPNGTDSLNPYFVAFLGVVSGLMAPNALKRIQVAGESLFRTSTDTDHGRYAIAIPGTSLREKLDGHSDQAVPKLAHLLGVDQDKVEAWVSGSNPAPLNAQQVIAVLLDKEIFELFHDIKTLTTENSSESSGGASDKGQSDETDDIGGSDKKDDPDAG
ncbi:hypothetical protein [Cohaesibacter gelatinilyticus]|uniref:Uncharacterized protein n=1 Tax=Cohaesibacter gelatinilyticus TaxID=372072 RepID=A0A285PI71_9HYPH|nr:hypothetical protein [Cohaesibacter gelatinilyticus]SNZ19571.1 hypothetical protein SAMN06265368_2661 [Cohaesibacter gelatinilyticus]